MVKGGVDIAGQVDTANQVDTVGREALIPRPARTTVESGVAAHTPAGEIFSGYPKAWSQISLKESDNALIKASFLFWE